MRILFYLDQFPGFGGIESVTATLAAAFSLRGHDISIVSWMSRRNDDQVRRAGSDVRILHVRDEDDLTSAIKSCVPDVVIFQDDYAERLPSLVRVLRRVGFSPKIIAVEHNRPSTRLGPVTGTGVIKLLRYVKRPYLYCKHRIRECLRRRYIYRHSYKYVVLSARYLKLAKGLQYGGRDEKFVVIPNPITRKPVEAAYKRKKQVIYVGTLKRLKGVDRLLAAWEKIEQNHAFDAWEFLIVGEGPDEGRLKQFCERRELRRVSFAGAVEDPGLMFAESSLMLMASDYEGWPMVLGEGMSNGCVPVVTNSFEAVYDILEDSLSGFIVRHFKEDEFVDRIEELMSSPDKLFNFSRQAIAHSKLFSLENVVMRWENLFRKIKE